jgi:NADPH:quinone reductase-like Zn-dependent oxidoreductase
VASASAIGIISTPAAGRSAVRIKASAVNPLDGIVRAGYFPIAAKRRWFSVKKRLALSSAARRASRLGSASLSEGSLAEQVQKLTDGKGADLVLDPIGSEITGQALAAVGTGGRLVHLGYSAGMSLTINSLDLVAKASSILGFNTDRSAKDLDEVVALAAQCKYRVALPRCAGHRGHRSPR